MSAAPEMLRNYLPPNLQLDARRTHLSCVLPPPQARG
jgi:hypothetical protein